MPRTLAIDTETFPMGDGAVAPRIVCASFAHRDEAGEGDGVGTSLHGNHPDDGLRDAIFAAFDPSSDTELVFHNAAFDLTVLVTAWPDLIGPVFALLQQERIHDTKIREMLLNLSGRGHLRDIELPDGTYLKGAVKYDLATVERRYLGRDRSAAKDGEDAWRLNYKLLDGWKAEDYPEDAATYAVDDTVGTLLVYEAQDARAADRAHLGESLATSNYRVAVDFALRLMTCRGIKVDHAKKAWIADLCAKAIRPEKLPLIYPAGHIPGAEGKKGVGLVRPAEPPRPKKRAKPLADGTYPMTKGKPESVNATALKQFVEKVCRDVGLDIKKTDPSKKFPLGQVSTDKEVIETLAEYSAEIKQYQRRASLQKIITTELPRLSGEYAYPDFNVLVESGRTSSRDAKLYPSLNIQNVLAERKWEDEGSIVTANVRECFVARPGFVLCSIDYSALEFVALAQTCRRLFGFSVLGDRINAGIDPHAYLGAQIAYALDDWYRERADRDLGTYASDAMCIYKHFAAFEKSEDERESNCYKTFRKLAKPVGFGYPGGLGAKTFISFAKGGYKIDVDEPTAKLLKQVWLATYPEMRLYFQHIEARHAYYKPIGDEADDGSGEEREQVKKYVYTSQFGMRRPGCTFCAISNGLGLQTPAAEGATLAVYETTRACYDPAAHNELMFGRVFPVAFIHDEILSEIVEDEWTHETAYEMSRIMVDAMKVVMPDIAVKAEPALMRRWHKDAKTVLDANGRLQVWAPKGKAA